MKGTITVSRFAGALPLAWCALTVFFPAFAQSVTVSGNVRGPEGLPQTAVVSLRNLDRGLAWTFRTDDDGRFRLENAPHGDYRLTVRAATLEQVSVSLVDVNADVQRTVSLPGNPGQEALTNADLLKYLPEDKNNARQLIRFHCVQCHGLELIVGAAKSADEWRATVDSMAARVPPTPQGHMAAITAYLSRHFGTTGRTEVPMTGNTEYAFGADAAMLEIDLPKPSAHPHEMTLGPDGKLWVSDFDVRPDLPHNSLFRIDPATLAVEIIELSSSATGARSIAFDAADNPWVTMLFGDVIARLDRVSGSLTTFELPRDRIWPHTLAFDRNGDAWFTGMMADVLGQLEPESGRFRFYPVPTKRSMLYDIEVDDKGTVWYTGLFAHRLGRFEPTAGRFAEFATPTPLSSPRSLSRAPDGDLWVALFAAGRLGRFDPTTERFEEVALPDPDSSPYDVLVTHGGVLWFSDFTRNSVTRLDLDSDEIVEYRIPSSTYARPTEMDVDSQGRIWFCENGTGKVGFIDRAGLRAPGVYRVLSQLEKR